jgi:hypothetical protein
MRAFLVKVFVVCLPMAIVLISVNYFGDTARIFSNRYEEKIVNILLSNRSVTNIDNYDERAFQQKWVKTISFTPEVVVIGSSKAMLIDSSMLGGHRTINSSVSGGGLATIENTYRLYLAAGNIPPNIIIGLDPWTMNDDNTQQRMAQKPGYRKTSNDDQTLLDKFSTLFSLTYFQRSLPALVARIKGDNEPVPTQKRYNITNTKNPDGSVAYGHAYRHSSEAEVKARVDGYLKRGDIADIDLLNSVSLDKLTRLANLISDMQAHRIRVTILLTPYHPSVYRVVTNSFPGGLKTEPLMQRLALKKKVPLLGSFDPEKCGLSNRDFYDAVHCTEPALKMILSEFSIK